MNLSELKECKGEIEVLSTTIKELESIIENLKSRRLEQFKHLQDQCSHPSEYMQRADWSGHECAICGKYFYTD